MDDIGEVLRDVSNLSPEDMKKQNRNLQKFLIKVIDLLKEKTDRCVTQDKQIDALKLQVCVYYMINYGNIGNDDLQFSRAI